MIKLLYYYFDIIINYESENINLIKTLLKGFTIFYYIFNKNSFNLNIYKYYYK